MHSSSLLFRPYFINDRFLETFQNNGQSISRAIHAPVGLQYRSTGDILDPLRSKVSNSLFCIRTLLGIDVPYVFMANFTTG